MLGNNLNKLEKIHCLTGFSKQVSDDACFSTLWSIRLGNIVIYALALSY